jgi:hypothetical protein
MLFAGSAPPPPAAGGAKKVLAAVGTVSVSDAGARGAAAADESAPSTSSSVTLAATPDAPYGLRVDLNQHLGMDASELHRSMKLMENRNRVYEPEVRFSKDYRRYIVDFICQVRRVFSLCRSAGPCATRECADASGALRARTRADRSLAPK